MNCKPGDLAVIVNATVDKEHIGKIVKCLSIYKRDAWNTAPNLKGKDGRFIAWIDAHLRPIRDNPGQDETLTWLDVPSTDKVTA